MLLYWSWAGVVQSLTRLFPLGGEIDYVRWIRYFLAILFVYKKCTQCPVYLSKVKKTTGGTFHPSLPFQAVLCPKEFCLCSILGPCSSHFSHYLLVLFCLLAAFCLRHTHCCMHSDLRESSVWPQKLVSSTSYLWHTNTHRAVTNQCPAPAFAISSQGNLSVHMV